MLLYIADKNGWNENNEVIYVKWKDVRLKLKYMELNFERVV